jgi:magnesium transporter
MIIVHRLQRTPKGAIERLILEHGDALPDDALWFDLVEPTAGEDRRVEEVLGIEIPTREEMRDIEPSSLLYAEGSALYMGARLVCRSETQVPTLTDISFILTEKTLVTVRYEEPRSFHLFAHRLAKPGTLGTSSETMLSGLVESIVDRASEVLRGVGDDVEGLSHAVFEARAGALGEKTGFPETIRKLGRLGDLLSHVRESMVSMERMLLFLQNNAVPGETRREAAEWKAAVRDVQAIEEHASFLSGKIQFVLDAVLGLVSLEQNKIVKIFSVLAVIFMPPTLIASIYGMNFKLGMIELDWRWGYPFALTMMVLSVACTYTLFRWRKWL